MTNNRKREAREKFLLGGIVVRAGLAGADRAFLLGGLTELASVVPGTDEHRRLRDIGEQAFKATSRDRGSSHIEEAAKWH
ncbi:conjugal transfer protein TraD (plasmid) [Ensifer adhaerens]|uniref:Conjugal transfer protein TraD n=1 Tax=Ensifer adhaerens TaxID=106592 RepID=A0ABY8HLL4_ENSAD|nr:conjugal transfer protein TraD [Ensifer adhaerens]ANK75864.1 conjugal transfer protein TraD [Ensifer adhaerens]KDP72388.1 conjugal transfer protein TraD [Ensifer adhaerens]MDF8358740.1 conjugal transfer protein TraD [Ensifer adhaerens]THA60752.1 conjugal transfer protein TraD [Ensifer adhaerens]WFP93018.1 conjugal transfer protein TraD [Ensifer adhaerens]